MAITTGVTVGNIFAAVGAIIVCLLLCVSLRRRSLLANMRSARPVSTCARNGPSTKGHAANAATNSSHRGSLSFKLKPSHAYNRRHIWHNIWSYWRDTLHEPNLRLLPQERLFIPIPVAIGCPLCRQFTVC
jgi:hypothetical protein